MTRYSTRRMLAAMAFAVLTVVALAQPASASDQDWKAIGIGSGNALATAHFSDAANRVYVTDTNNDGTRGGVAARMNIWRVGNEGGTHVYCPVGSTGSTNCPLIWAEDTHLKGQLCQYPSGSVENCSPTKEFWS